MRARRALFTLLLASAGAYALTLAFVVLARLTYPFEIEWMEGGELTHAARMMLGQRIYVPPSADFVPFFYTPLYPMVVAALAKLGLPLGFTLGRAVSALSTLATMTMLYAIGARLAGRAWGVLAACLYAALFRFAGAFYDVARPDALELALVLGAALTADRAARSRGAAMAGVLLALAFLTKQTAAVFGPPIALCLFMRSRRLAVVFTCVASALAAVSVGVLTRRTEGWFWFYVFQGHQGHRFIWGNILLEYWRDVLYLAPMLLLFPLFAISYGRVSRWVALGLVAFLGVAFVSLARALHFPEHMYYRELWYEQWRTLLLVPPLAIAGLLAAARLTEKRIEPVPRYWLVMVGAAALASGLNHSTQWAYANCFMPLSVFGSLAVALVVKSATVEASTPVGPALVLGAAIVQLAALAYNPAAQIPSKDDQAALALFERRVSEMAGPVLIPSHPLLEYETTGRVHLHQMGIGDVAFSGGIPDLGSRIAHGEWPTIIVDDEVEVPDLAPTMFLSDQLPYGREELYPKTGFRVRPRNVWRIQDRAERDLAPGVSGNFEAGVYRGWTASGNAFGRRPASRGRLGTLDGIQGNFAASSRSSSGVGKLESAPFVLDKPRVTMLVAGARGTSVRAMLGDQEIGRVQPVDTKAFAPKSLFLDPWVGKTIVLELVDEDENTTGAEHTGIVVDDLRMAL